MDFGDFDHLQTLDKSSTNWKIKVRVTRMWPSVTTENGTLKGFNLILLDDDNYHLHAFAYHNIWNSLNTTPVEGGVYIIDQFSVKDSSGNLKPVQSKLCIKFMSSTTVEKCEDDGMIPLYKFEFLDLGDLYGEANKYSPKENPEYAIDIIGVVEEFESVRRIATRFGDRDIVKFRICDESNDHKVSIWGDLALSTDELYGKQTQKPILVIVTSTKLSLFMSSVQIATLPSSKVYFNLDDDSVAEMRLRIIGGNYKSKTEKFLESVTSDPAPVVFEQLNLMELNEKLTYDLLKKKIWCMFKVVKVDEQMSWWFFSCGTCQSEVQAVDNKFKCVVCSRTMPVADRRFRILVLAEDSTFSCNILLMDRVVKKIIRTSAARLLSDLIMKPEEGLPKVITNLVGKEISAKIALTKSNVTEDSIRFHADDVYETRSPLPSPSEIPHCPDYSTINLTDSQDCNEDVKTPGSAKSVTKKVKKEP